MLGSLSYNHAANMGSNPLGTRKTLASGRLVVKRRVIHQPTAVAGRVSVAPMPMLPHARRTTPLRGCTLALAWLVMGCGDADPTARVEEPRAAAAEEPSPVGDPLLARARDGIRDGSLPEPLLAEVLGSTAAAHARAQRVLLAMAVPLPGTGDGSQHHGPEDGEGERPKPPPLLPPGEARPEPEVAASTDRPAVSEPPKSPASERPVRAPKLRADLGGLSLKATSRGATLTIAAPSSLVVGVANQPASGIVRLVIESAEARSAVLHARPSTEGAAVTGVRQGQGTVQITIRLEPGWSLGSVQPFSGGAKVHLVAPP